MRIRRPESRMSFLQNTENMVFSHGNTFSYFSGFGNVYHDFFSRFIFEFWENLGAPSFVRLKKHRGSVCVFSSSVYKRGEGGRVFFAIILHGSCLPSEMCFNVTMLKINFHTAPPKKKHSQSAFGLQGLWN